MSAGPHRPPQVVRVFPCPYKLCDNAIGQSRLRTVRMLAYGGLICPCRLTEPERSKVLALIDSCAPAGNRA